MIVGYQNGSLFYGENTAGAGNAFQFTITPNYLGIDVGQNSTPTLVDINRDGALDLVEVILEMFIDMIILKIIWMEPLISLTIPTVIMLEWEKNLGLV